jgi:hypothetical protein
MASILIYVIVGTISELCNMDLIHRIYETHDHACTHDIFMQRADDVSTSLLKIMTSLNPK